MSETTSVRLNDDECALLDDLAEEFGGRSAAIKQGLQMLARDRVRRIASDQFMAEWAAESGPPDPVGVAEMRKRYFAES